jgi:hypothetical protein
MRRIALFTLALALVVSTGAFAKPAKQGVYVGGSIGQSYTDVTSDTSINIDDEDFAYKLYAGYRAANFFAVEGGYRDLGKIQDESNNVEPFTAETIAWDAAGVGILKIGIFDIFGKIGIAFWDTDLRTGSESDTSVLYGIGAAVRLGGLAIRLEYELIDADFIVESGDGLDGLEMLSLGVTFTF